VIGPRGQGLHAELPDGRRCYLPFAWTDREPRPDPLELAGEPVRLAPQALLSLSRWLGARVDRRKLDRADREDQKRIHGVVGDKGRRDGEPAAVVGKARAPRTGRSRRRAQQRGTR
jgi:hypothetical protein